MLQDGSRAEEAEPAHELGALSSHVEGGGDVGLSGRAPGHGEGGLEPVESDVDGGAEDLGKAAHHLGESAGALGRVEVIASAGLGHAGVGYAGTAAGGVGIEGEEGRGRPDDAEVVGAEVRARILARDHQSTEEIVAEDDRRAAPLGVAGAGEGSEVGTRGVALGEGQGHDPARAHGLAREAGMIVDDGCAREGDEVARGVAGANGYGVAAGDLLAEGCAVEDDDGG